MRANNISLVEEYPLPFDREEIIQMQEEQLGEPYGLRSEDEVERTVDGFHAKYIEEMVRTDEWSVFRNHWQDGGLYFWNFQLGHGFRVEYTWEVLCPLVEMMDAFTDEYDASDFEPKMYPWELP